MMPCRLVKVIRRSGGNYRFHLQDQAETKQEPRMKQATSRTVGDDFLRNIG
jgi:hypothetical protein